MADSRCGLRCTGCAWKASHGCGGCIETMGNPFHGACPIARCCQERGLVHCGECDIIPCGALYAYSYLDPEHGDTPQGARVETCRRWAAEEGNQAWQSVLLTSAGLADTDGVPYPGIADCLLDMLGKPKGEAKVLFIPTAAIDDDAREMAEKCLNELLDIGFAASNIVSYNLDGNLTEGDAMAFDMLYVTGGDTGHLLRRLRETDFDATVKKMVYANKVYVGVSAGSLIATPNIGGPYDRETAGLCLAHAYLSVHCPEGAPVRTGLPLPHVPLPDRQALAVRWDGYQVVGA